MGMKHALKGKLVQIQYCTRNGKPRSFELIKASLAVIHWETGKKHLGHTHRKAF